MHFSKFAECATLLLVMMLDMVLTLVCQSVHYQSNYEHHEESAQVGRMFLLLGPERFVVSFLLYAYLILYAVFKLPRKLGHAFFVGFLLGHSWGSTSWLPKLCSKVLFLEIDRWYACSGYFVAIALVYALCLYIFDESKEPMDLL